MWFVWMVSQGRRRKQKGARDGSLVNQRRSNWGSEGGTTRWGKARGVLGERRTGLDA
jgi:hypothetical protein